jgi:prepilin signal peptidase PulO-like enzyme (type II secretory pathway)
MIESILIFTALAILIMGTFTDFKIREVPDWINYAGMFIGIGLRLIYSTATSNWDFVIAGLLGFGVFYAFALVMFYLGQWGGGDSKMLMALGALLGLEIRPDGMLVSFAVNMLLVGALYGMAWSIYLAVKHRKKFAARAVKVIRSKRYIRSKVVFFVFAMILAVLAFGVQDNFLRISFLIFAIAIIVMFYLWFFVKTVEECCMIKMIPVEKLTEGDWIVKDVKINGKRVCGPKDLGISKEQIKKILSFKKKGKIDEILIKEGMPFIPSFLLAFIVTLIWGNIVLMFV